MNLTDGTVRAQAGYTYDTAGRIATVGDGGDTLTYAYAPGTGRVASTAWNTATGNNTAYTYDSYHRLTGIAVNNTPVYGYTLNDKNQRTAATLENGDNWAYTYDTLGQLTGALKKDSQDNTLNNMSYAFDLIGNRTTATEDAVNWTYASNLLNQYTQVNALLPSYNADGNMLTWNGWIYTWNGENRLVTAENTATGIRLEAEYDFLGRRIFKKVYTNNTLTEHRKFAYNGYKLIAEFDALNSNALLANYLWQPVGLDVPLRATIDGDARYFVADGNKNIIALKDTTGATTDDYTYTPFGAVTASGSTDNPFRFSSEYHDAETGLVYYNYRYYNPTLGRWSSRDPLGEKGAFNLYAMVYNNSIRKYDLLGEMAWYDSLLNNSANFFAGAADSLTFGITDISRGLAGINYVDYNSAAYITGETTELVAEVAVTGGSSLLTKSAAKAVSQYGKKALVNKLRKEARKKLAEAATEKSVHHINTLLGHPAREGFRAVSSHFPVAGLPRWMVNSKLNLVAVGANKHTLLHIRAFYAEQTVIKMVNPRMTSLRGFRNVGIRIFRAHVYEYICGGGEETANYYEVLIEDQYYWNDDIER